MPAHKEIREVGHSPQQLFDLVSDIEKYPEFLPWCIGVRVRERGTAGENKIIVADVLISYKMFREKFRSRVEINPKTLSIDVEYLSGPFKHLDNHWKFEPHDGGTRVDFAVDFEFKSRILERMVSGLFDRAVHKVVTAFFDRADELYGVPAEHEE
ncbi:MAG: type II toxin-antitoxin system RatA family toxin [Rhodobiaceae bacterium]|nr:type II toxin-antitoxin system RatA family toxin [Rhodobiaceae bacterium]